MINENYMTFVEICKKPGVYVDKKCNFKVRVKDGELWTLGRDGKTWERHVSVLSNPNKRRFLLFKRK